MNKNLQVLLTLAAMGKFTHVTIGDRKVRDRPDDPFSDRRDYTKPCWAEQGRREGKTTIIDRRTITGPNAGGRRRHETKA